MSRLAKLCENKMKMKLLKKIINQINEDRNVYWDVNESLNDCEKCYLDQLGIKHKENKALVIYWEEEDNLRIKSEYEKVKAEQDFI